MDHSMIVSVDTPMYREDSIASPGSDPYLESQFSPWTEKSRSTRVTMDKSMIMSLDTPIASPPPNQSRFSAWTEKSRSRVTSMDKITIPSFNTPWFLEEDPTRPTSKHPYAQSRFSGWSDRSSKSMATFLDKSTSVSRKPSYRSKEAPSSPDPTPRSRFSAWTSTSVGTSGFESFSAPWSKRDAGTQNRPHPYAQNGFYTSEEDSAISIGYPQVPPMPNLPRPKERVQDLDMEELSAERRVPLMVSRDTLCQCHHCTLSPGGLSSAGAVHSHDFY